MGASKMPTVWLFCPTPVTHWRLASRVSRFCSLVRVLVIQFTLSMWAGIPSSTRYDPLSCASGALEADDTVILTSPFGPFELDEIPFAGSCRLAPMSEFIRRLDRPLTCFRLVLNIVALDDVSDIIGDDYRGVSKSDPPVHSIDSRKMYETNIRLLNVSNVLEKCSPSNALAWVKYFEVLKKNNKGRAIMDSRQAGSLFKKPLPVNLPVIREVLKIISKSCYFWTADFKHWYYQIHIGERLSLFFRLLCNHRCYRLKVLPQGWSWSCFIAQTIAWSIILYYGNRDTCPWLASDVPDYTLPSWLPIRHRCSGAIIGGIFLWYDNILVCSSFKAPVQQWARRIMLNAASFHVHFSDLSTDPTTGQPLAMNECEYVGIKVNHRDMIQCTEWRHTEKRIEKMKRLSDKSIPIVTPRGIARLVGFIIWDSFSGATPS